MASRILRPRVRPRDVGGPFPFRIGLRVSRLRMGRPQFGSRTILGQPAYTQISKTLSSKVGMPIGRVCDPSPFGI